MPPLGSKGGRAIVRGLAVASRLACALCALALGCNDQRTQPAAAPAPPTAPAPAAQPRAQPDVVIITVDTLRPDHLGAYGHAAAHTPNIDRLAERGVRFAQATTSLPRTTPALASLLTGLEPRHHGSREVGRKLEHGTSLATFAAQAGYATLGVSGTPVAGPGQRLDRGFSKFEVLPLEPAPKLTEWALAQLAQLPEAQPLLLWVHYTDPHFDYRPPEGAEQPPAPACRALMARLDSEELDRGDAYANRDGVAAAALSDCKTLYDAEIAYTDSEIGRLLDGLRAKGRLARAHVLFSADHGEHLGERGLYYEHGPTVHDADLRIPLLWNGPGIAGGRVDRAPARLEDITPSLLALLGIEHPGTTFDGRDLRARLAGQADAAADAEFVALAESGSALQPHLFQFISSGQARKQLCMNGPRYSLCQQRGEPAQLFDRSADPGLQRDLGKRLPAMRRELEAARERWPAEGAREYAARGVRFKLVRVPLLEGGYRTALYDLEADPQETSDVSAKWPQERARLERVLSDWVGDRAPEEREAREPDPTTQEALRALGYVQ